jgi:hypothetical protein
MWIWFFILSTLFFGITAFPLEAELKMLSEFLSAYPGKLSAWVEKVYLALKDTNEKYPFLAYGTDWLAFAHIIIAVLFIGPLKDPVRNSWIIDWGIISCILALPIAFIGGPIRQVPFFHQMIDVTISLVGLFPLLIVRSSIRRLKEARSQR